MIADLTGTRLLFEGKSCVSRSGWRPSSSSSSRRSAVLGRATSPARSTRPAASCSSGASSARGSCDEPLGRLSCSVEQVRCVASPCSRRTSDLELARRVATRARQPSPSGSIRRDPHVRDAEQARSLADGAARPPGRRTRGTSGRGTAAGGRAARGRPRRPTRLPPARRARSRRRRGARRGCRRSDRRRRARTATPTRPRLARARRRRADARTWRNSGRACRACRRARAGGRRARPRSPGRGRSGRRGARARAAAARRRLRGAGDERDMPSRRRRSAARTKRMRACGSRARSARRNTFSSSVSVEPRPRRAPRARGTRAGSRCRRGSPSLRATPRPHATSRRRAAYSPRTRQITCPLATASPAATTSSDDGAGAVGDDLVLHLHRLDDADDVARLDHVSVDHVDREHGPLHRADDGVAPAPPGRPPRAPADAARAPPTAAPARAPSRRSGGRRPRPRSRAAVPAIRRERVDASDLLRSSAPRPRSASSAESTTPWQVVPATKQGCESSARWKPSSVGGPASSNSSRARSIRIRACSRSTP